MRFLILVLVLFSLSGCFSLGQDGRYIGPQPRTADLNEYYSTKDSYSSFSEEVVRVTNEYVLRRIKIETWAGQISIDYYKRPRPSDELVLVFPVLGGRKNLFEDYFADVFTRKGYEAAIVQRNDDFKNPDNYDNLEEIFRLNVVRDRIALDFFERQFGKKRFGSFGISRGAINVAITAGIDARLKYNVLALGGADIIGMFKNSDVNRLAKYKKTVMERKNISEQEFYDDLKSRLRTDPNNLAPHMDARDTLLIMALFDSTVPIKYGQKLRRRIGRPETVYLAANHFTSLLYTQFVKVFPPVDPFCIFPLDFIETEALDFYDRKFKDESSIRLLPLKILKAPFDLIANIIDDIS